MSPEDLLVVGYIAAPLTRYLEGNGFFQALDWWRSICFIQHFQRFPYYQQVEMRLRHIYFHRTMQYHVVNCACVLHHFMNI